MSETNDNLWTISELAAEAANVLSVAEVDQRSGRVTEVPSTRTIRYYTTHGLLDRPADYRGRTALYGRRHLLQLVAIKRLQARGTPLTEIQGRLVGAADAELESLAELEPRPDGEGTGAASEEDAAPRRRQADFWAEAPAKAEERESEMLSHEAVTTIPAVRLGNGVSLTLDGAQRDLYPDDLDAIRVAAEPLLKLLNSRHLLSGN